jgi:branched-chain amino acid aminotransferase
MELAKDMGMIVENRPVNVAELSDFNEVGACGTAAVITPIRKIVDLENNIIHQYCLNSQPGSVSSKLYNKLTSIQFGDEIDKFGWISFVD